MRGRLYNVQTDVWSMIEVGADDECWPWIPVKGTGRYGQLRFNGIKWKAPNLVFFFMNGFEALECMHRCNNKECCNPSHLRSGTRAENTRNAHRDGLVYHPNRGHNFKALGRPSAENGRSKLTDEMADDIRAAYKTGLTQVYIAKRFGVSQMTVSKIVRNLSYNGQFNASNQRR